MKVKILDALYTHFDSKSPRDLDFISTISNVEELLKLKIKDPKDQLRVEQWIYRLCLYTTDKTQLEIQFDYAKWLQKIIMKGILVNPFRSTPPSGTVKLRTLEEAMFSQPHQSSDQRSTKSDNSKSIPIRYTEESELQIPDEKTVPKPKKLPSARTLQSRTRGVAYAAPKQITRTSRLSQKCIQPSQKSGQSPLSKLVQPKTYSKNAQLKTLQEHLNTLTKFSKEFTKGRPTEERTSEISKEKSQERLKVGQSYKLTSLSKYANKQIKDEEKSNKNSFISSNSHKHNFHQEEYYQGSPEMTKKKAMPFSIARTSNDDMSALRSRRSSINSQNTDLRKSTGTPVTSRQRGLSYLDKMKNKFRSQQDANSSNTSVTRLSSNERPFAQTCRFSPSKVMIGTPKTTPRAPLSQRQITTPESKRCENSSALRSSRDSSYSKRNSESGIKQSSNLSIEQRIKSIAQQIKSRGTRTVKVDMSQDSMENGQRQRKYNFPFTGIALSNDDRIGDVWSERVE